MLGLCLSVTSAQAQGLFSPLTEVCPAALDVKNYTEDEKFHLIKGQGAAGWLFGAREFGDYGLVEGYLPELKALQAALKSKGTELVIVFLPPRGVAEKQYIDPAKPEFRGIDFDKLAMNYHDTVARVNELGIYAPDLLALKPAGVDFYFPRDHHWNPVAIKATGDAVAQFVSGAGLLDSVPTTEYKLTVFTQALASTYTNISNRICRRFVLPSTFQAFRSEKVSEGLLDDESIPIALAGDSNTFRKFNEESFAAYLRWKLQRDVLNAGVEGGGATAAIENIVFSDAFQHSSPRLLIWEMDGAYALKPFLKELALAALGDCQSPLRQFSWTGQDPLTFDPPVLPGHYLVFNQPDVTVRTLQLQLSSDVNTWPEELSHAERAAHHPHFFLGVDEPVSAVKLLGASKSLPMTVSECSKP